MTPASAAELALLALLGLVLGSFVVTAALRAARSEPFFAGRSHCDNCGAPLSWLRTAPLLAYAGQGGRAACCQSRIDPLHPLGEALGAGILILAALRPSPIEAFLVGLLGLILLALAVFDRKALRLPDPLVAVVAALALTLAITGGRVAQGLGAAAVTLIALILLRLLVSRRVGADALGLGDVKLLTALALWLGVFTPLVLSLAALTGLIEIVASGLGRGRKIAFGPHIALAGFAVGSARPLLDGFLQ